MLTKHFLKTLILFLGMIIVGLTIVFLMSYFEKGEDLKDVGSKIEVAE